MKRIGFLGDSITQGIGSTFNSYNNFAAIVGEEVGESYAFWNLGLGYGRASDAASDGIWLEKAKNNNLIVLCYGVNDIFREKNADKLKSDLKRTVTILKENKIKVIIQTIPPFDYSEEYEGIWNDVNEYIRKDLSTQTDALIDDVPILSNNGKDSPKAKYGGHPNDAGCRKWAEIIIPKVKSII